MSSPKFQKGFTLMELAVVLAVIGVIAVSANSMLGGRRVVSAVEAKQLSEHLVASLRMARTTAILHSAPVLVTTDATGYTVVDASGKVLQPKQSYAPGLDVSWTSTSVAFQPTGTSDQSLQIRILNDTKQWRIDVLSASGQASLRESLR